MDGSGMDVDVPPFQPFCENAPKLKGREWSSSLVRQGFSTVRKMMYGRIESVLGLAAGRCQRQSE